MNKKVKEHLIQFLITVETKWFIIGGIICALLFDLGLFVGIIWGNH